MTILKGKLLEGEGRFFLEESTVSIIPIGPYLRNHLGKRVKIVITRLDRD